MNPVRRWLRFNLVGALGMAVQLSTLAALHHIAPAHYLADTALAVELTLLHNFAWHTRYTWRDRLSHAPLRPLLRFHLANGLISLAGNLALMRLFVHTLRLPVLAANILAIACCSAANFLAAHAWAFRPNTPKSATPLRVLCAFPPRSLR